ncbi:MULTISPECIES: relaxase/mobilization nuclease [unclassified Streptomyces]|uniref:relaxase/mobilization nuclease n=1 Tax=Streptomyces TaxID=1883 RepID=UPI0028D25E91|nr:relaxase/mobilization nuclease [Streptomyces sp. DSM 40907]
MIIAIHSRDVTAEDALAEALGREISLNEGLTTEPGGTVVAHSNRLDHYNDEDETWSSTTWADHLAGPSLEHPLASGPDGDRRAILHVTAHMHPLDRELNHAEWSEIGYRIARVAGIAPPGDDQACQWIAVQAQPGRLDVIANLIRLDGTWSAQPRRLLQTLVAEARSLEADLLLHSSHRQDSPRRDRAPGLEHVASPRVPTATGPLAGILRQLAAEQSGPISTVRQLVEEVGRQAATLPGDQTEAAARDLFWTARRLYGLQEQLGEIASRLQPSEPSAALAPTRPVQAPAASRAAVR